MLQLIVQSFFRPRETMAHILRMNFPENILFRAGIVVCAIIAAIEGLFVVFAGKNSDLSPMVSGPIALAIMQFGILIFTALLIDRVGGMFGGTATFRAALTVAVWYTIVALIPNIVVLYLQVVGNDLAPLIQIAVAFWMVIVFTSFVQIAHGFRSAAMTAIGVLGTAFIFGLLVLFVLGMLGVLPVDQ